MRQYHRVLAGGARIGYLVIPIFLLLAACSAPLIDGRPSDGQLRAGIDILISRFETRHPELVSWNDEVVKIQLAKALPMGRATEAGWTIDWPSATSQELSRVVVPWQILGGLPKRYENDATNYVGGTMASKRVFARISMSTAMQIRSSKDGIDPRFAAIVNVRLSKIDPSWAIFTAVPYLSVTDIAYGWAKELDGYWHVADFGTALVGCGVTPLSVEKEFGFSCPAN